MGLGDDNELGKRILTRLPANEEELALLLGTTREHVESVCAALHRQKLISLDRSWDTPRHWKRYERR